ncbi:uncharacterized protein LOC123630785 [Lemur catta]|uniref:uncharacterized protein LOC123630785 n=1 Tax=Lemur catta TaxID=9447 RepID=UPI001E26C54F|nr:uncharacterized protein LOC123630785 [Lemur catta]
MFCTIVRSPSDSCALSPAPRCPRLQTRYPVAPATWTGASQGDAALSRLPLRLRRSRCPPPLGRHIHPCSCSVWSKSSSSPGNPIRPVVKVHPGSAHFPASLAGLLQWTPTVSRPPRHRLAPARPQGSCFPALPSRRPPQQSGPGCGPRRPAPHAPAHACQSAQGPSMLQDALFISLCSLSVFPPGQTPHKVGAVVPLLTGEEEEEEEEAVSAEMDV